MEMEIKEFKSFMKTVGGNEGNKCHYPTRLDTYGCGCSHDCKYCYAKSLLDFRKLWNPENPSIADIEKIKRKIAKLPKDTPAIRLGGMTDCFQPIEKSHKVTYETIKCLNEYKIPYLIVTKSAIVADDEYIEILDKNLAHIQITVTTTNDELSKTYEKASVPSERIRAIEKLQAVEPEYMCPKCAVKFYVWYRDERPKYCEYCHVEFDWENRTKTKGTI